MPHLRIPLLPRRGGAKRRGGLFPGGPLKILVTGAAGFIGMHVSERLLVAGNEVVGIDNLNDYYDVRLKQARLENLRKHANFRFERIDIADEEGIRSIFSRERAARVIHLAAQAGVRYSLQNPEAYVRNNLVGFVNILEGCRHNDVEHLVYGSSSSVYGGNTKLPFAEHDNVDHPISLYAATKKSNELMAHTYSHLFGLPTTGLRFFTVYGPWGRPDMALFLFTKAILDGEPIKVFNHGDMQRDFTYIDDIAEGVLRVADRPAQPSPAFDRVEPDPATSWAPYRIYNVGNHRPVSLMDYIEAIENSLGKKAEKIFFALQAGDVPATNADIAALQREVGYAPRVTVEEGVRRFVEWYRSYYRV